MAVQIEDATILASTTDSRSLEINSSSSQNHHTAFMQCRACCNCNSGCSYYGKGKFDAQGNYLGS